MKRRELMLVGASTAIAHGLVTISACAGQQGHEAHAAHAGHAAGDGSPATLSNAEAIARAAAGCTAAGEACLAHCLQALAAGHTSFGECATSVRNMLAVCGAVPALLHSGSAHAASLTALCVEICKECKAACDAHAGHAICAACAAACKEFIEAAA